MKEFLKKIKLIDILETEIEIQKIDFVSKLKNHVDESNLGFFSDSFEIFSSSKNDYKGQVDFNGFKIKKKRRFFDMSMNYLVVAEGVFTQKQNILSIKTELNGLTGKMAPYFIFLIIFYLIFIFGFSFTLSSDDNIPVFVLPFIIFHAMLMFGIPYFMMKKGIINMKKELEREFFYIAKK